MSRAKLVATLVAIAAVSATSSASGGAHRAWPHTPSTGGFSAILIDALAPATVYAASGSHVFKSSDGGGSWQAAHAGLPDSHIWSLVGDRRRPATLYAATGRGVFKSTDGAHSWRATALTDAIVELVTDPTDGDIVYAATDGRVSRTSDGGNHWDTVLEDAERFFAVAVDPRYPSTIYVGAGSGVFKSINGGFAWRIMSRGLLDGITAEEFKWRLDEGFVTTLAIAPRNRQTLYLGSYEGVFKSTDAALRWRAVNNGLTTTRQRFKIVSSLAIDPKHPRVIYAGVQGPIGAGLSKTSNGGRTWRFAALPDSGSVYALAVDPQNPRKIYAGTNRPGGGGQVFRSLDGGRTWRALPLPAA